jgi:hypothetical protein
VTSSEYVEAPQSSGPGCRHVGNNADRLRPANQGAAGVQDVLSLATSGTSLLLRETRLPISSANPSGVDSTSWQTLSALDMPTELMKRFALE